MKVTIQKMWITEETVNVPANAVNNAKEMEKWLDSICRDNAKEESDISWDGAVISNYDTDEVILEVYPPL